MVRLGVYSTTESTRSTAGTDSSEANVPTSNGGPPSSPHRVAAHQSRRSIDPVTKHVLWTSDRTRNARRKLVYCVDVIGCSSKVFNPEIIPAGTERLLASRDLSDEVRDDKKLFFDSRTLVQRSKTINGSYLGTIGYPDREARTVRAMQEAEGKASSEEY